MSLDEDVKERFLADTETILEAHLDDLEGMFRFHEDGTIEILGQYRNLSPVNQTLLYLIARRYQYEAGLAESDSMPYDESYGLFPEKGNSTVRGYFMNLRQDGFARKSEDGHQLVVERLPEAIDRIESNVAGD